MVLLTPIEVLVVRVVFFDFVTHFGGAQRVIMDIAGRLRPAVRLHVLDAYGRCSDYVSTVVRARLPIQVLDPATDRTFVGFQSGGLRRGLAVIRAVPELGRLAVRLRRSLCTLNPDCVWTTSPKALALLAVAFPRRAPPAVFYHHGSAAPGSIPRWAQFLMRRRVDTFQVLSQRARDNLVGLGIAAERIRLSPGAVDVGGLRARSLDEAIPPLPALEKPVRLLLPASLIEAKGHDCAIRALGVLVRGGYDAVLWLAGDLPEGAGSRYLDTLRHMATEEGVEDRVHLLGLRRDLPRVISMSTMVILPSRTEGLPRVIMEAMALEKPVAATPVGGVPDLILPGTTGWLHEVDDHAALAAAVVAALEEPFRSEVVQRALEHVSRNFTFDRLLRTTLEAFESAARSERS